MGISTKTVEEAHCDVCNHTWIVHEGEALECPECRRRASTITKRWKYRHLCISCHTIWTRAYKSEDALVCPTCKARNEEGQPKQIATDLVDEFVCGSCGNAWIKDDIWNPHYVPVCSKCGCGTEKALEYEVQKLLKVQKPAGEIWSSYRGYVQKINMETGEIEPSNEEIDARISAGLWKENPSPHPMWSASL